MVLFISSVSGIVNVLCLVTPATLSLFIFVFFGAIIIAQWAQWIPHYKMWLQSISVYTGMYQTRASGIRRYFPQLLKYHDAPRLWFWGVHIKCYLEYAASTINACSTRICFQFTGNYYLVKHLVTGLNMIKRRNCYHCVTQNGFINSTEDCNALLVRINHY